MLLILICAKQSLTFSRRAKRAAGSPPAPVRQSYPLPSPNGPRSHSAAPWSAPSTLGPLLGPSRRPRGQEQSACYLHDLGPLMALPSRRGASHVRVDLQNTRPFGPLVGPGGAPGVRNGALALARCTFHLKMMLPPQRGAHFPHLAGHEHHLGPSKLSSRCCAVRFLKNELSLLRGALFYTHL